MSILAMPRAFAERLTRANVVPLSIALLAVAGVADFLTGVDVAFTLVYLAPIALATWFRGFRFGAVVAVGAALSGTYAELVASDAHHSAMAIGWNQGGAFVVYVVFVWLLDALHRYVAETEQQRSLAVSQLRHAERLSVIGTLAAGVAHEIGTPLSIIQGTAEMLEKAPLSPSLRKRETEVIRAQVARITRIVSHLLEFGRRGGGGRASLDAVELVEKAAVLMDSIARKTGCTIALREVCKKGDAVLVANAGEIEQVLANLVLNAMQAMPGGGEVRLGCIVDGDARRGRDVCLSVEDDGGGIRAEDMPKIFDPFFTTKEAGKGTGLGLSVSYGIVDDHRGRIYVRSEVGRGTRFEVRLPLA